MRKASPSPRNHVAKAVWTPRYRPQVVQDKRKAQQARPKHRRRLIDSNA